MEKGISYLNRNFNDYRDALIAYSEKYYPDTNASYDDASIASWLIDLNADVADNLSYHIDRVYQETNIDSAQELGSLYSIARNNGIKIPGPKGSMAEVKISCILPVNNNLPDETLAPIIKKGTIFASSTQNFELQDDVDFAQQFDDEGNSNRTITPKVNTNGIITAYTVSKVAVVVAGETRIYRQSLSSTDITPFMEVLIPVENVMNVESIITVDGIDNTDTPTYGAFFSDTCSGLTRFYEVNSLSQQKVWVDKKLSTGYAERHSYGYATDSGVVQTYCVTRGEWKPVDHKFITEYTDKGYLKVIFGAGTDGENVEIGSDMKSFSKWQISKIINNDNLGALPKENTTLYILYRMGGGKVSNVAKGAINRIVSLNADFRGSISDANSIMKTITVTNTTPSVSGKDMPSIKELKYLIKYSNAAQERCVTVKDYIDRILNLPPKYGTPFRVGVMEENNKIMVYLLGIDYLGKLDTGVPLTLIKNIEDYLSEYRMINDYVEIKAGRIINLSFEADIIVDKNYNKSDVVSQVINEISDYMDVNNHLMGEEIYVGDLEKEISKTDGVINLIELRVYNVHSDGYSQTIIGQETIDDDDNYVEGRDLIDLSATDGILYNDGDTMMEIKDTTVDIKIKVKER